MAKVVVTAKVEDIVKWEEGFRTHGDLFRRQTITKPINISIGEENEVAVFFEPENLDTFMQILESEGPEAMASDGVIKDSAKVFILDKEFKL